MEQGPAHQMLLRACNDGCEDKQNVKFKVYYDDGSEEICPLIEVLKVGAPETTLGIEPGKQYIRGSSVIATIAGNPRLWIGESRTSSAQFHEVAAHWKIDDDGNEWVELFGA